MSTAENPAPRPYASAIESYWQLGWNGILPLPPHRKSPPPEGWTGWEGDFPSWADVFAWSEERPTANVGLRMPRWILGVDVDDYASKHGGRTLAECEAKWGPLPPTWRSSSREDPISGIRFFKVPEGIEWPGVLPGGDVETVHFGHRYAVVCPSIHPEGRVYRWIDPDGLPSVTFPSAFDMPLLPVPWLLGLAQGQHTTQARADMDGEAAWSWIEALPGHNVASCAFMAERTTKAIQAVQASGSRHDATRDAVLALVRFAESGHRGVSPSLDKVRASFLRLVTGDASRTSREASAEWGRILTGAVRIVAANPEPSVVEGDPCPTPASALRVPPPRPRLDQTSTNLDQPRPVEVDAIPPAETPDLDQTSTISSSTSTNLDPPRPVEVERTSWWPKDLRAILDGDEVEVRPTFLARSDGECLFYAGKINGIIGPSESGKTWLALETVRQAIRDHKKVLYLDFEDGAVGIITRLMNLGCGREEILTYLRYIRPEESPLDASGQASADFYETMTALHPDLIIVDGVNAAMGMMGYDLMSNRDATDFSHKFLSQLVKDLAAVVYVDHTPKNDSDSKGGIGAQAKRAMTTGCCLKVEVAQEFGHGQHGILNVIVDKDRLGYVRGISVGAKVVGVAHFDSDLITETVNVEIRKEQSTEGDSWRPTKLMADIRRVMRENGGPMSTNAILSAVNGNTQAKGKALRFLIEEGYVEVGKVGSAHMHTLYETTHGRDLDQPRPTSTGRGGENAKKISTRPPRRGDGRVEASGSGEDLLEGDLDHDLDQGPNPAAPPAEPSGPHLVTDEIGIDADGDFYRVDTGEKLTQRQADRMLDEDN